MNKKEKNKLLLSIIEEIIKFYPSNEILLADLTNVVFLKIKKTPHTINYFSSEKEWRKKISFYCSSYLRTRGWVKVGKSKNSVLYRRF